MTTHSLLRKATGPMLHMLGGPPQKAGDKKILHLEDRLYEFTGIVETTGLVWYLTKSTHGTFPEDSKNR